MSPIIPKEHQYQNPVKHADGWHDALRKLFERFYLASAFRRASPSVLPALGQEGELIAAWGAARIVTRSDRQKEKMRREMWSKIEI